MAALVSAIIPFVLLNCTESEPRPPAVPNAGGEAGDTSPADAVLPCIAPAIAAGCALAGCHDAETREHGMDLSTGDGIYAAWVDRNGLDHCRNTLEPRVVPGDPEASYVYRKLTNDLACEGSLSQRMPPPPYDPLADHVIEAVRAWILAGAPRDCDGVGQGGDGGASGAGSSMAGAHSEAGRPNAGGAGQSQAGQDGGPGGGTGVTSGASGTESDGGRPGGNSGAGGTGEDWDPFYCDAHHPCTLGLICAGSTCGEPRWQCVSHFAGESSGEAGAGGAPEVLAHPCPEEVGEYCGCDGVTFEAFLTCPDRPFDHAGACGDGYNCDIFDSKCGDTAKACDADHAPAVVNDCFADCVPIAECRCEYDWECPEPTVCNLEERRCASAPEQIRKSDPRHGRKRSFTVPK